MRTVEMASAGAPASTGKRAGPFPDRDLRAELADAPQAVRTLLVGTAETVAADLCEFSETCCPRFGAIPRTDCARLGDEAVAAMGMLGPGAPLAADTVIARRCIELVHAGRNDCVFATAPEWQRVCRGLLRNGDRAPGSCTNDDDCDLISGEGFVCAADGECIPEPPAMSPEHDLGEPCSASGDCRGELYCETGRCTERKPLAAECGLSEACSVGLKCSFPSLGESPTCVADRQYGEACSVHQECWAPGGMECIEGICTPVNFADFYCAPLSVDDIASSTALPELSDPELDALCTWAGAIFEAEVECMGQPVRSTRCKRPSDPACDATISQYRSCWPRLVSKIDGCRLTDPEYLADLRDLVRSTAGCGAAVAACVEMLR